MAEKEIPECDEFAVQFRNIKRLTSADWINTSESYSLIDNAHLAAEQCYEACNYLLSDGGTVVDTQSLQALSWDDIENRLQQRKKELECYRRISQNLPFNHWAGVSLGDHESTPTSLQNLDPLLRFLNNRHTIQDHIEISDERLSEKMGRKSIASRFLSHKIAEQAIARALAFYWEDVVNWLTLTKEQEPNPWRLSSLRLPPEGYSFETGREIGTSRIDGQSKNFIATAIQVILVRDNSAPKGFWIKNAFPSPA